MYCTFIKIKMKRLYYLICIKNVLGSNVNKSLHRNVPM